VEAFDGLKGTKIMEWGDVRYCFAMAILVIIIILLLSFFPQTMNLSTADLRNYWTEYFCGIVAAILKMATGRNFSISGIKSGHHYLPTYQIWITSDNTAQIQHCQISTKFHMWVDYDVPN
jgi:hypothetical protein